MLGAVEEAENSECGSCCMMSEKPDWLVPLKMMFRQS
jgi:hypothetical protein